MLLLYHAHTEPRRAGYQEEELPSEETIRCRLNEMGYSLKRVVKAKPQKKIPETDAIFEQIHSVNQQAGSPRFGG